MTKKSNSISDSMRALFNSKDGDEKAKIFKANDSLLQVESWISLKPFFKQATGGDGFPCGHITQIIGKPDSGKTTLMMEGMVSCQKEGGTVFLIDAEHKFSLPRFELMGGSAEDLIIIQVDTLEEAWNGIYKACDTLTEFRNKGFTGSAMLCWDSVAASVPKRILHEKDSGDAHVAVEAKINNKNVRKLRSIIKTSNISCVFINHYYMTQPKTPYERSELIIKGGEELTFFSTLVIKTKQGAKIERTVKGETQKLGRVTRFEVHKGHFHGRTIVKDVYVVDTGIIESEEQLASYKTDLKGSL